jgi:predicted nucleotidyltransferase
VKKRGEIIPYEIRSTVSMRYRTITRAINREFWYIASETANSVFVGSYGRGTAVDTSDIDILVELPQNEYNRYDSYKGNGQSRLLQTVRSAIQYSYPRSEIRADGQVVKVLFSDGMKIEVLPAFSYNNWNGSKTYIYPNSNMGGNWQSTNPKAEQAAMHDKNKSSNGLLLDTCKHMRYIRDNYFSSYHLSGIVIDSFVYASINGWHWTEPNEQSTSVFSDGEYEIHLYNTLVNTYRYTFEINAPGSNQPVSLLKSRECLEKVLFMMTQ